MLDGEKVTGAPRDARGQFINPPGSPRRRGGGWDWLGFYWRRIGGEIMGRRPAAPTGHVLPRTEVLAGVRQGESLTWLGHDCFTLRMSGRVILTDPFLSDHAAKRPPYGPRRFAGPGLGVADLPPIDLLVVSHDHYDHLDMPTIAALPDKGRTTAVVPLGLGPFLDGLGFARVVELDWHRTLTVDGVSVTALPAQHGSGRALWDRNDRLWCGFAIRVADRSVYFAGDTGYGPFASEIGRDYGPFDLGLVPIGAYEPRVLMDAVHLAPEEAVALGRDVGARAIAAMHWGTIVLTDEPWDEPPGRFLAAGRAAGYGDDHLWVMKIGETRPLP